MGADCTFFILQFWLVAGLKVLRAFVAKDA